MERHQVPVECLANAELAQALQTAHTAKTPRHWKQRTPPYRNGCSLSARTASTDPTLTS
jgi:hypothetical protein